METDTNEHYITFPMNNAHEGIEDNISHEEICEPIDENDIQQTEITVDDIHQEIENETGVEILTENSEDEDQTSVVYPIYLKKKTSQQFTTGDESMAVEALRQLGGMYPCFENNKVTCFNCASIFTQEELIKHQSSCMVDKHECKTCGEKFERKIDLTNHIVCHQVDRPHACRTCGNLFRSKTNLQTHMVEIHQVDKPHKCTVCGADFQRPSSLSNHMKIHTYVAGRALIQDQKNNSATNVDSCKNISDSQEIPALTTAVQSTQNFEIPQVQWAIQTYNFDGQNSIDSFTNQSDKTDSLQEFTVLPNGEVTQFGYTTQNVVNNQIGQQYSLTLNSFDNNESLIKVEAVTFNTENKKTSLEKDTQENKSYTCNQCGVSFARAVSLTLHEKVHVKNDWSSPIDCEFCDKQFQDSSCLVAHQVACTKKLMQNNTETNTSSVKWGKHTCSECGKKFTTKQKMFRHQWIHRKKTYSCEVCGLQFVKQPELDEHRLSAHPGDSPFTCNFCGKCFVSRQGLWEHGRTHAGSPAYFHCDTCSKTFSSRQGYLIHHRTHTGERPYGCKFCWKSFRDGGTLRKHERIHTGERPHVCPLCARAFNQKVVLREHVRWVHAAGKNETEVIDPPFSCPLCGSLTQDRDELCAHIVKHSDQMIADAKAKSNNIVTKKKLQKKKGKTIERKTKAKRPNDTERQAVSAAEQNEALLSISEQIDIPNEIENTYFVVKNEYDDAVYIKTFPKADNASQGSLQGESVNVIAIAKSCEIKNNEKTVNVINRQATINSMHLIPFATQSETIHFISAHKQNNTLHLISKQNENLPVLAIPNPDTNENFSNQISIINNNCESSINMTVPNSALHNNECKEDEINTETIIIESVVPEIENNECKDVINEENSDNESEELVCGICGNDFEDKNVLMEHVKIHI